MFSSLYVSLVLVRRRQNQMMSALHALKWTRSSFSQKISTFDEISPPWATLLPASAPARHHKPTGLLSDFEVYA